MGIVNKVVLGFFWALTCMAFSSYVLGKILVGAWLPWYTNLLNQIFISNFLITLIVLTVVMVILAYLCYRSAHQNPVIKIFLLTLFALVTGAFVSPMVAIALALDVDIAVAFAITGGIFFFPAIIGWITDKDLTEWRNWILGLLMFAIVISVINLFYPTTSFTLLVSIVVVIIFVPLVMYDVNRIRNKLDEEEWIVGVVDLFLDFLNIFVRILYILILIASKRKS